MHTYIRDCSHYMSRGREAAVKSFFIHTSGNVFIYAHTFATAVITCPRDMQPQGVVLSDFFVPHDFTPVQSLSKLRAHALDLFTPHCKKSPLATFVAGTCRMKFDQMNFGGTCCSDKTSVLQLRMYVHNLMLSLLRASDTGACFSPHQVNKTGIDRRSTSLRRVLAAVLNRLCRL